MVALVAAFAIARGERVRGAFVLVLAVLAVYQVRNVHIAVLAGAMLLARFVDARLPESPTTTNASPRASLVVLPGALLALALGAFAGFTRPREAMLGPNVGGADALALLERVPDGARISAPFGISPLVIWYAFPRGVRVLYDSRNDCYPPDVALTALEFEYSEAAQRNISGTVARFGAEYAIARKNSLSEASFLHAPAWQTVESRGALVLFARR